MSMVLHITINHDGAGLLDEFGPDSEWAYWFDNPEDDEEAYRYLPHSGK